MSDQKQPLAADTLDGVVRGLIAYINATPEMLSLLYDMDLLPEQVEERSVDWMRMLRVADLHRLMTARNKAMFDGLVAVVNTAQLCPDRCMADVCNDNFLVHRVPLRAEMTEDEDKPILIEWESPNAPRERTAVAGTLDGVVRHSGSEVDHA